MTERRQETTGRPNENEAQEMLKVSLGPQVSFFFSFLFIFIY
jgi:hypothetical protein